MGARTTKEIAEFVCNTNYEDLPSEVINYSKILALSHLGMNIAGSTMDFGRMVTAYIEGKNAAPEAGAFGAGFRTSADYAALVNGNAAHATELEDCSPERIYSVGHWPTVFAMGEKLGLGGKDVIEASVVGYEVATKIARAFKDAHAAGKQNATCCALGNAAASAKLLQLDIEQTRTALSLAASQVAGIRNQAGSGAHVIEAGFAGRNGICAAELAALGYTARPDILEGKRGFGDIWSRCPEFDLPLGQDYSLMEVSIRKYACCNPAETYMHGMNALIAEHHIAWDDVVSVEHAIHASRAHSFRYDEPTTAIEARFSLPHITVACFFDKSVFLQSMTEEKVHDPRWREARKKVKVTLHEEGVDENNFDSSVTMTMRNGVAYRKACPTANNNSAQEDGVRKYRECMSFAGIFSPGRTDQIAETTLALDRLDNLSTLSNLLIFPDIKKS